MLRKERTIYTYTFEEKDRQALKGWLKKNKLRLKDMPERVNLSYIHLDRIVTGKRPASATLVNKLRKLGVRI